MISFSKLDMILSWPLVIGARESDRVRREEGWREWELAGECKLLTWEEDETLRQCDEESSCESDTDCDNDLQIHMNVGSEYRQIDSTIYLE